MKKNTQTTKLDKKVLTCQLLSVFMQIPSLAWASKEFQLNGQLSPLGQLLISPNLWNEPSAFSLLCKHDQKDIIRHPYVHVFTSRELIILEAIFMNIGMRGEEYVKPDIMNYHITKLCKREDVAIWFTAQDVLEYIAAEEYAMVQAELS